MHTYGNETERFVNTDTAAVLASEKKNSTITNSTLVLMGATGAAMIVSMSVHNILLGGLMIATAIAIALPKQSQALLTNFEQIQRKYGVNLY
ncbi:MAG: hypothetical protein ACYTXY_40040, partial [Nostoc sp.]